MPVLQLHLAFLHDFTRRDQALQQDINFSNAINNALKDSGKAFIAASAIGAAGPNSQPWKESDPIDTTAGRGKTESATLKVRNGAPTACSVRAQDRISHRH